MTLEELHAALLPEIDLTNEQLEAFSSYAKLLKEWSEKMNLTTIVEEGEVNEKHFLDSLIPCKHWNFAGKKIADMGSGAGFPGIAIAIAFPDAEVTLIDATKKKFLFLEEVVKALNLKNVKFHVGRVEQMKKEREKFDIVISRGFAAMRILLEVGAPLTKKGGVIVAMKSQRGESELKESLSIIRVLKLKEVNKYTDILPSGEIRNNYFFMKMEKTPRNFPRDWATILNKPLA